MELGLARFYLLMYWFHVDFVWLAIKFKKMKWWTSQLFVSCICLCPINHLPSKSSVSSYEFSFFVAQQMYKFMTSSGESESMILSVFSRLTFRVVPSALVGVLAKWERQENSMPIVMTFYGFGYRSMVVFGLWSQNLIKKKWEREIREAYLRIYASVCLYW